MAGTLTAAAGEVTLWHLPFAHPAPGPQVAQALAVGRAPDAGAAAAARFDESLVGAGGAGYKWAQPPGYDVSRYSIALPPMWV